MSNGQPISKVLQALLKNITKINGCEKQMIEILLATSDNQALFENILSVFMTALREPSQLEQLCVKYVEVTESLTDEIAKSYICCDVCRGNAVVFVF